LLINIAVIYIGWRRKNDNTFHFYFFKNYQSYGSYIWYTSWQRYL